MRALCLSHLAVLALASNYTPDDIQWAADVGAAGARTEIRHHCNAEIGGLWNRVAESLATGGAPYRSFLVVGQPPLARVAWEVETAAAQYRPRPDASELARIVKDDVFTVLAFPDTGGNMITAQWLERAGVQHMVIRRRGDKRGLDTVPPTYFGHGGSERVSNLFGATAELQAVMATFDSQEVIRLSERADIEVLLLTAAGEFKCNLDGTRIRRGYRVEQGRTVVIQYRRRKHSGKWHFCTDCRHWRTSGYEHPTTKLRRRDLCGICPAKTNDGADLRETARTPPVPTA